MEKEVNLKKECKLIKWENNAFCEVHTIIVDNKNKEMTSRYCYL